MKIRKLLLPALITAALAVPSAFAQSADATDKDNAKATASKSDSKADPTKADARKDGKQDAKSKPAKKDPKSRAGEEQPDEPEEDGR
ncbi:MAG TPA: hypothetical protein VFR30_00080 [Lysobacter sp.]|nr:hypothetical protein [Lysobacter sp.]